LQVAAGVRAPPSLFVAHGADGDVSRKGHPLNVDGLSVSILVHFHGIEELLAWGVEVQFIRVSINRAIKLIGDKIAPGNLLGRG
jgi:hypothetical protein